MAPKRTKNATTSNDSETFTRPQIVSTKSPARTPIQSPRKKMIGITVAQKQALIDNLQLEVTERARKLRAQYALQAQSLRTRIELRVNRIPTALRKANMGELLEKYLQMNEGDPSHKQTTKTKSPAKQASKQLAQDARHPTATSAEPTSFQQRGIKRSSDEISTTGNKENAPADIVLPNPKKRAKAAATTAPTNTRLDSSTVFSPKSANSRTIPRRQQQQQPGKISPSAIKDTSMPPPSSPAKRTNNASSRPTSPLKPLPSQIKAGANTAAATSLLSSMLSSSASRGAETTGTGARLQKGKPGRPKTVAGTGTNRNTSTTSTATNATSTTQSRPPTRGKRIPATGPPPAGDTAKARTASNTSSLSTTSMSTTIVNKAAPRGGKAATGGRKIGAASATAAARGAGAATAANGGRRVLRKR